MRPPVFMIDPQSLYLYIVCGTYIKISGPLRKSNELPPPEYASFRLDGYFCCETMNILSNNELNVNFNFSCFFPVCTFFQQYIQKTPIIYYMTTFRYYLNCFQRYPVVAEHRQGRNVTALPVPRNEYKDKVKSELGRAQGVPLTKVQTICVTKRPSQPINLIYMRYIRVIFESVCPPSYLWS